MRTLERLVMLGTIDRLWVEHLTALEEMRQGIGLAGYGGQDPLVAFKREAHDMWEQLSGPHTPANNPPHISRDPDPAGCAGAAAAGSSGGAARRAEAGGRRPAEERPPAAPRKVGRNDPCPCGSGLKYKKCCGRAA